MKEIYSSIDSWAFFWHRCGLELNVFACFVRLLNSVVLFLCSGTRSRRESVYLAVATKTTRNRCKCSRGPEPRASWQPHRANDSYANECHFEQLAAGIPPMWLDRLAFPLCCPVFLCSAPFVPFSCFSVWIVTVAKLFISHGQAES